LSIVCARVGGAVGAPFVGCPALVIRVSVHVVTVFGTAVITVSHDGVGGLSRYPLYRVDNSCEDAVLVKQEGVLLGPSRPVLHVPGGASHVLGWDEPSLPTLRLEVRKAREPRADGGASWLSVFTSPRLLLILQAVLLLVLVTTSDLLLNSKS
jgi:hypothetical protein